jgi:hypothetical protein
MKGERIMKRFAAKCLQLFTGIMLFMMNLAWASGEGLDMPETMDQKVPLEGLTGIKLFFSQLYNDNLLMFAIICTVLMAAVGMIIAYVTDFALKMAGLEVEKISHEE